MNNHYIFNDSIKQS